MVAQQATQGQPAELIRFGQSAGARAVTLVPGAEVPLIALDLPEGLRGQAREDVARRQLKDRLGLAAEDIVMRPFALAGTGEAWTRVLLAAPAQVASWRAVPGRAVLPDYLALPAEAEVWTLSVEGDGVRARLGLQDGFSAALALAPAMLRAALAGGAPKRVLRLGGPADAVDAVLAETGAQVTRNAADLPPPLSHGEAALDLRRDPQAARAQLRRRLAPWRWPYLFAACAAGLWAAAQILEIRDIEARTATMTAASRAMAQQHFVPSGPILDIRTQVARALAAAQAARADHAATRDPWEVFGAAAEVIAAAPNAATKTVRYTSATGLVLSVELPDFAAAEALVDALTAAGLPVARGDTRTGAGGGGVRTELRLDRTAAEGAP